MATPYFYRQIRRVAKDEGIPFIVDETKTGVGSTGKFWALEHWNLQDPADIVTFAQRTGIAGFFSKLDFKLAEGEENTCFQQNTDPVKIINFGLTWKYMQKKNILSYVGDTSTFLKIELGRVHKEVGVVQNLRGYGTYLGFDVPNERNAEQLQKWLFISGIHMLRCGPLTYGLRPSLLLGPKDAAYLRDILLAFNPNFHS